MSGRHLVLARSVGGSVRAVPAWWPTAASSNMRRPYAKMTNANDGVPISYSNPKLFIFYPSLIIYLRNINSNTHSTKRIINLK